MKKICIVLLSLTFCSVLFGQSEASYWYFGQNAGLRFDVTSGTVTAITDGQINTLEGCTSISDSDGNLLFYSDGKTVWNQNHQVMPNGDYFNGTGLLGDPSSTSSGLIVPKPQDPSKYYIFTVDEPHHNNAATFPNQNIDGSVPGEDDGFNNGFNYSLIDMTLNSGLGDVDATEKNIHLITYDINDTEEVKFKCSEKITAVRAEDCSSFWVITQFTNKFYAFRVDVNGVDTTPVISTVGPNIPVSGYRRNALGYLKASPDGSKIIVAHYGEATTIGGDAGGSVYLFDFDSATGVISNSLELYSAQNNDSPYGVEFSAENKKAYATIGLGISGSPASQIVQWDLESDNIPASIQVIHSSNDISAGALQLGIDRRIYRAQLSFNGNFDVSRFIGVINNPEADGLAANYDEQGIRLDVGGGLALNTSRLGLPPFIQSLFNSQIDIIRNDLSTTELRLCTGDSYTLQADDIPGADYFWSFDGNPLPEDSFELFVDTPGFYEVYIEPNNGDCPIEGSAVVGVYDIPVAHDVSDVVACDDAGNDGLTTFDFTPKDSEALSTQNPADYNVRYFESLEEANNRENEITFPYTNISDPQTIYVRVENSENPNCFDVTNFELDVFNTPQIVQINNVEFCDNEDDPLDGIATIDLSELVPNIVGTQENTEVTFHSSQDDADSKSNELPMSYTNSNPFNETIFIRIENTTNTTCYSTQSFELTVNDAPIANDITILQCDEDGIPEGFTTFNISQFVEDIIDNNSNRNTQFYLSQNDAENQLNEITNPEAFDNFFNPQIIYTRVTNTNTGCVSYSEISLEVSLTSSNNASIQLCDTDGNEDGFMSFNLNDTNAIVLAGAPAGLNLQYFETYEDALIETNSLASTFTNTIPYNQTIYARVENANACYGISQIELTVLELPNIETEAETHYCLNFFPETIVLDGGVINDLPNNYSYLWSTGEDTATIEVNAPGNYTVRVFNANNCFKDRTITVLPSNIATITDVEIIDASQNNSISVLVSGEGDYEFAIDDSNGPYQDSNTFSNLQPGLYTVFVRDKNNCGISEELVSVIGFPKFFTPNDDSKNDYWQVKGISSQFQANSSIFIFNRHGKLLKELDPLSAGWDGTYNGEKMPTSDYWFKVILEDGRTYTSHFTLKR
ncbi:T9SS type B sorting domain-containing protein [Winogradskyella echinorum]|uniref:T9SS type B sorting domain-containing protein n=1 Tax=Winogradskyella echinorum TaxID=538189 RepID=A0ABR6Y3C7_9FLAO|nr:T9SS type B sorting domain-containing protein [Winogradskyella echinorum]MBC3847256.1 T9SS type B sorting domain-containing protein [Winogradskyella echinorum]MBC5751604.1 T9SS type B sorting domain-containing protein [Winogradskyella echinorum]